MSTRRTAIIAMLIASPLFVACGSSGDDSGSAGASATPLVATDTPPTTVAGDSSGGGVAGALIAGAGGIDDATSASCDINRQVLENAVLAFQAVNGADPTTQDELVGQFVVETVPAFEIAADATVQPLPDGPCVGH